MRNYTLKYNNYNTTKHYANIIRSVQIYDVTYYIKQLFVCMCNIYQTNFISVTRISLTECVVRDPPFNTLAHVYIIYTYYSDELAKEILSLIVILK